MRRIASLSNAVLLLIAVVLGNALAIGWTIFVIDVLGQEECDNRGACSWIGDLSYGTSANIVAVVCMLLVGGIAWAVRAHFRHLKRRQPFPEGS